MDRALARHLLDPPGPTRDRRSPYYSYVYPHEKRRYLVWSVPALVTASIMGLAVASDGEMTLADLNVLWFIPIFGFLMSFVDDYMANTEWYKQGEKKKWKARRSASDAASDAASSLSWQERRYGQRHQELREHWAGIIREHGATCSERVCVMPTRRIAPGAWFDLAHDHQAGGDRDYLGPAHPDCNRAEAERRLGVVFEQERGPASEPHDQPDV